jgi:hypothetical protein
MKNSSGESMTHGVARAFLALSLAVLALLPQTHVRAEPAATVSHVFVAVDGDGHVRSGLHVVERATGSCWINSIVTTRPDAWRCASKHFILDPCFALSYSSGQVACVNSPFSPSVTILRLSAALPRVDAGQAGSGLPWALRLSSGDQCVFVAGASSVVAGMRANYFCKKSGPLFGSPDTKSPVWRIFSAEARSAEHLTQVSIAEAVY